MKRSSRHKRRSIAILSLFLVLGFADRSLLAADGVTLAYDYIRDSNQDTFHSETLRLDYRQVYGAVSTGTWPSCEGSDCLTHAGIKALELGGFVLDSTKSSYGGWVRFRRLDTIIQLGTDQVLADGYVLKYEVRYIGIREPELPDDKSELVVLGVGFDKYYGDYHYFSVMYHNDPREAGRFSVVISNTFATKDSHLRIGIVPRNDGTRGYFATVKYHWAFIGYAYTREFDFATFDRRVITVGLQVPFDLRWSREE